MKQRELPHDLDAEASVLGAIFLKPEILFWLEVDEHDFHDPRHRVVYGAMTDLLRKGTPLDEITVQAELVRDAKWDAVGGFALLSQLVSLVPTADNVEHYARIIQDRRVERDLALRLGEWSARILRAGGEMGEGAELLDECLADLSRVEVTRKRERRTLRAAAERERTRILAGDDGQRLGAPTGFQTLDEMITGLLFGKLTVLAADTSVGKSLLILILARAVARAGFPALVCTWEDYDEDFGRRALQDLVEVDGPTLRRAGPELLGNWITRDALMNRQLSADADQVFFEHCHGMGIEQVERVVTSYVRGPEAVRVVFYDYLQRIPARGHRENVNNLREHVVNRIDAIAGRERIAAVLGSQLNQDYVAEKRAPSKRDLRDSKATGNIAKQVLIGHPRPDVDKQLGRRGCPISIDLLVDKDTGGRREQAVWLLVDLDRMRVTEDTERYQVRDAPPRGLHADD